MRILLMALSLFVSGCDTSDTLSANTAEKQFQSMCDRSELYICGDSVDVKIYNNSSVYDLIEYANNNLNSYYDYRYTTDMQEYSVDDYYTYMNPKSDWVKYGDCEDYAITFIEDNIINGNIDYGDAEMMFGRTQYGYHMWAIINKDGESYVFDTYNPNGSLKSKAYVDKKYKEVKVIYSFKKRETSNDTETYK